MAKDGSLSLRSSRNYSDASFIGLTLAIGVFHGITVASTRREHKEELAYRKWWQSGADKRMPRTYSWYLASDVFIKKFAPIQS